jgi:hypothetical protein
VGREPEGLSAGCLDERESLPVSNPKRERPIMTVAEVLAAHASSRMSAAKGDDEALRAADQGAEIVMEEALTSFVVSWAAESTVIGAGADKIQI